MSQLKEALITTLRTLVANDSLPVEFDENAQNNFFSWDQNLVKNHQATIHQSRSAADLAAAYLLFHNPEIHQNQQFFNEFEKVRVIAQIKDSYRGAAQNILDKVKADLKSNSGVFLPMILLAEIFPEKIFKNYAENLAKNLDQKLVLKIKNLSKKTDDQSAFLKDLEELLSMLESDEKSSEESENLDQKNNDFPSSNEENIDSQNQEKFADGDQEAEGLPEKIPEKSEIKEGKEERSEVTLRLENQGFEEDKIEFKKSYKIYTTKFDEVVFPQKMISKNELESLRNQLELKLEKLSGVSRKMTLKLKRKLLSKRDSFLESDSSRGILDRKKLTRLVIEPLSDDIWINNKQHEYQDTCLTILLDNSGSMRGQPIAMAALACEIIAEILENFSIKTEIIGFTTCDWKGGKARKLWESSGRPLNPGRLNELRHIIYKHFNQKFKKAKTNLGLMLKEGILKENIDGEALLFARSRLMQQSEKRKILLVISDGTPVDDSTNSANENDILTNHLHHVIKKIEKSKKIEIVGIGIGHATDEFYRNSTMIRSAEELGDVMIEKIVGLV
jgi:cobaltochelatase CobT